MDIFLNSPTGQSVLQEICIKILTHWKSVFTQYSSRDKLDSRSYFRFAPLEEAIFHRREPWMIQLSVIGSLGSRTSRAKRKSVQGLRQSILKQAFTGKLVPQSPNDEPASELLKRIAVEREARAQEAQVAKRRRPASRRPRT